jgi:hypothetical protein
MWLINNTCRKAAGATHSKRECVAANPASNAGRAEVVKSEPHCLKLHHQVYECHHMDYLQKWMSRDKNLEVHSFTATISQPG